MAYFVASWGLQPDVYSGLRENSLSQVLRATTSSFLSLFLPFIKKDWNREGLTQGGLLICVLAVR